MRLHTTPSHHAKKKTTRAHPSRHRWTALALALALPAALMVWAGAAAASCNFLSTLAAVGSADGQVLSPRGLATDTAGNVFVADQGNNRIQKFDSSGALQLKFGSGGSSTGQFIAAFGVALDGAGNIYVTDSDPERTNHKVQKFNSSGVFLTSWGNKGGGSGNFANGAGGVAVDSAGNVYVTDPTGSLIHKYTSTGTFITSLGGPGSGNGQYSGPLGVAVDASDNIYVADTGNNRVQVLNPAGTYVRQFGTSGSGDGQLSNPFATVVDASGNVYVADTGNNRIEKFDSSGAFVSSCGSIGTGNDEFSGPQGVAVDASGNTYVADTGNDRVQKFGPAVATPPTADAGPDQTIECAGATTPVALNGTASTPGSGSITSYSWSEGATSLGTGATLATSLPSGSHTITLTVTDTGGGSDTDDVIINIVDTAAPSINVLGDNPMTVECHATFADPGATATDACAGSVPVNSSGTVDANTPGTYEIHYTASDGAHTASATRTVNVVDTSGPTITLNPGQQMSLWPPNHKYQTVSVADFVLSASDACDSSVNLGKVYIAKITSDEAENGNGDGNTLNDIVIAPGCKSAQLRAERDGGGDGRVYTITFKVVDAGGNSATATAKVTVPKSSGGSGAVDSGVHYTVNSSCP